MRERSFQRVAPIGCRPGSRPPTEPSGASQLRAAPDEKKEKAVAAKFRLRYGRRQGSQFTACAEPPAPRRLYLQLPRDFSPGRPGMENGGDTRSRQVSSRELLGGKPRHGGKKKWGPGQPSARLPTGRRHRRRGQGRRSRLRPHQCASFTLSSSRPINKRGSPASDGSKEQDIDPNPNLT